MFLIKSVFICCSGGFGILCIKFCDIFMVEIFVKNLLSVLVLFIGWNNVWLFIFNVGDGLCLLFLKFVKRFYYL